MTNKQASYPFSAIVGQERMKTALILNLINPRLGGVLIQGEKGTAKSTAVRAAAQLLPGVDVVNLPVSATEDRVVGTLDIQHALAAGEKRFEPGLLAQADGNILYVDEINLLDDHIVDVLLDAAASGVNTVEREGISHSHPSRFILVGTMNPEEGDLRPQLLDRFGLFVEVAGETEVNQRMEVIRRRLAFEADPAAFMECYREEQAELTAQIEASRRRLAAMDYSDAILAQAAQISIAMKVDGHRSDITLVKTAAALAAYQGAASIEASHLSEAAAMVLPHRMKRTPFAAADHRMEAISETLGRLKLA
ncbi:ATP-binding protein [Paenibacillus sp. YN15]|uniref:ATP-binding protein n=1 Tax=Paenibacillus sp. YN15 TaxID=1742774 RepID=UPI000DCC1B06|nr:AAA family ATPase [Paenibacillus sp. YN15]RAV05578.1 magnesium chelatase [Paenibacillus sp. YN15]